MAAAGMSTYPQQRFCGTLSALNILMSHPQGGACRSAAKLTLGWTVYNASGVKAATARPKRSTGHQQFDGLVHAFA
ncbi:hypothetical protein DES53_104496 [Roseimicrobium gellanilyticum]|uniref:Uncharacterized protein n=1 Tax=Roseimicrobium gellanilyticum TaxID=748857 RepID=A0A366HNR4_9BACT|nr:hypothetical protein DES53_104496 [Roseimicrobium gellanilyticum]